ncbi:MAG: MFS transporter [Chloroflexi bacterium]|nr:MFS transporter [Chloroflexota bacterium]
MPSPASILQPRPIPQTFSSLRHRNFKIYLLGQTASLAGTWMQIVAQGWLVYQISKSEFTLGLVAFASAIPALIISPWGGVLVDRIPRQRVLLVSQFAAMALAFILAALTLSGTVQVWHVILISIGVGIFNAFDAPARLAFVFDLVERDDLSNAIALNAMLMNSARVIGPAFGGFILATLGAGWCFFFNGLSFLSVIVALLVMRVDYSNMTHKNMEHPFRQLLDGIRYVFRHVEIFALLQLSLFFSVFGLAYTAVLPAFVDRVLQQDALAFGAINAATGLGAVAAALWTARHGASSPRGKILVAATLLFPITLFVFALNSNFYFALLIAFVLGLGFVIYFIINPLLQARVEDSMRGRVLSLYTLTYWGLAPFGNLSVGNLAETWGLNSAIAWSAIVAFVLTMIVWLLVPKLRTWK